jgi:mycothiol synthase
MPTIRPFTPADLPALVTLTGAVNPDLPTSLAVLEARERSRNPALVYRRWVAEEDGELVATAAFYGTEWFSDPHRLGLDLRVHPGWQGRGLGQELYALLEREWAPHAPTRLGAATREDRPAALHLLHKHGYTEASREQESELDLTAADLSGVQAARAQVAAAGYRLLTFADYQAQVGTDPAWAQLHALDVAASQDSPVPAGDTLTLPSLERYRTQAEGDPHFDPALWFLALAPDGAPAGLSQLHSGEVPGRLETGFTGVARAHRRRGLAQALKLTALTEARQRGARTVRTTNDSTNAGMLAINTALGFVPVPAWLVHIRVLA